MATPLIDQLVLRHGLPRLDHATIDAFLSPEDGAPAHAVLFFTGDATQRPETVDVAVVLPELLAAFRGRLRGAVIARDAEDALKARFHVAIVPSLVVTRGDATLGVLPRVRDWAEYLERIECWLDPSAPPLPAPDEARIPFTFTQRGDAA